MDPFDLKLAKDQIDEILNIDSFEEMRLGSRSRIARIVQQYLVSVMADLTISLTRS